MGYVRFLLAAIVAAYHTGFYTVLQTVGALAAVEAFFLISGFYMAAAYVRYYGDSPFAFWLSRYSRLYPFYALALVLTYPVHRWFPYSNELQLFSFFAAPDRSWLINFSMLGLDMYSVNEREHHLLLVPQAWSISAELIFYMLVPLMVRLRPAILAVLVVLAFAGKAALLTYAGWRWAYYPFFGQIGYFLLGVWLFFVRDYWLTWPKLVAYVLAALYTIYVLAADFADVDLHASALSNVALTLATAIITPTLFKHMNGRISTLLGDLSYGVYLIHMLVIQIGIGLKWIDLSATDTTIVLFQVAWVIVVSSLTALGFEIFVQKGIDVWRRKRFYSAPKPCLKHDPDNCEAVFRKDRAQTTT